MFISNNLLNEEENMVLRHIINLKASEADDKKQELCDKVNER